MANITDVKNVEEKAKKDKKNENEEGSRIRSEKEIQKKLRRKNGVKLNNMNTKCRILYAVCMVEHFSIPNYAQKVWFLYSFSPLWCDTKLREFFLSFQPYVDRLKDQPERPYICPQTVLQSILYSVRVHIVHSES